MPPTPVVGVGASAGGVEALEGFFRGMPPEPGIAIVVVTHLSPSRESHLADIISRQTGLSVEPAQDGVTLQSNHVYVLSSEAIVGIEEGVLKISEAPKTRRERKPIDIFLSSLAKDRGEYCASVILSGADGDGTLGSKAIKERGGLTIAQVHDGASPSHPDMPNSAISTGFIDFAVPADQMGEKLAEFARGLALLDGMAEREAVTNRIGFTDNSLKEIYALLRQQVGHDFSGYKNRTFIRRIQRRMQVLQIDTLETYIERLRREAREVNALFRDLLINVTNFFRDAEAFEKLQEVVIPRLFENRGADDTVRVWIPGCATGEEVFSIAILIREHLSELRNQPRVQIFATDIDERSLNVARAARYPEALLDTVSPERLSRFFVKDAGSYVVTKDVRDLCIFSPHSVIRDPPFSRIDLVSCRNLLIYFGPDIQSQVIPTFHYSLRSGGYLFLGTSENVSQFTDLFTPVEKKLRIFRAKETSTAPRLPLGLTRLHGILPPPGRTGSTARGASFRQAIELQVLERFAPAHVVADSEGEIVYFSTRTGKYLEQAGGAPTRQLFAMARRGLRLDLRSVFRQAVESGKTAFRDRIEVEDDDGRVQFITVRVEPLHREQGEEPLFAVLFLDDGPVLSREDATRFAQLPDRTTAQLETELRDTRERLQSIVEEYETALEELKSSNEELVSVNEELQSTNEELEASKEELQSLNEELHTVNAELHGKVDALDSANSDLQNLFENTQVATIFLDRSLNIRTFTPGMTSVFNILPGDRGRPLTDLASQVALPTLADDVRAAAEGGEMIERRLEHRGTDKHYLVRVAPYQDADRRLSGAVITFVDVSSLARAERHHKVLIEELNHRVKNMLAIVLGLAKQIGRTAASKEAFSASFESRLQAMSRSYELVSRENWRHASLRELLGRELAPFPTNRVSMEGPAVELKPGQALSLGMAIHELATNAAKYGALSCDDGRVQIEWSYAAKGRLRIVWHELEGPAPDENMVRGFGLRLIEAEVAYNLRGTCILEFSPTGLEAAIEFVPEVGETDE